MTAALDLLSWPDFAAEREAFEADMDAAAADVERAHQDYAEALRRSRCAPHGETRCRKAALKEAAGRLLAAEVAMDQVRRREPSWT